MQGAVVVENQVSFEDLETDASSRSITFEFPLVTTAHSDRFAALGLPRIEVDSTPVPTIAASVFTIAESDHFQNLRALEAQFSSVLRHITFDQFVANLQSITTGLGNRESCIARLEKQANLNAKMRKMIPLAVLEYSVGGAIFGAGIWKKFGNWKLGAFAGIGAAVVAGTVHAAVLTASFLREKAWGLRLNRLNSSLASTATHMASAGGRSLAATDQRFVDQPLMLCAELISGVYMQTSTLVEDVIDLLTRAPSYQFGSNPHVDPYKALALKNFLAYFRSGSRPDLGICVASLEDLAARLQVYSPEPVDLSVGSGV